MKESFEEELASAVKDKWDQFAIDFRAARVTILAISPRFAPPTRSGDTTERRQLIDIMSSYGIIWVSMQKLLRKRMSLCTRGQRDAGAHLDHDVDIGGLSIVEQTISPDSCKVFGSKRRTMASSLDDPLCLFHASLSSR